MSTFFNFFNSIFKTKPKAKPFRSTEANTIIASVFNDEFVDHYIVLYKSIIEYNPWFNYNWIVYHHKEYSTLSPSSMERLIAANPKIQFKEIDVRPYKKVFSRIPAYFIPSVLKLEIFKLSMFRKIVFFDADMLCMGSIKELFDTDIALGGCLSGKDYDLKEISHSVFAQRAVINGGLLILNNKVATKLNFMRLLRVKGFFQTADQGIINTYFRFMPKYLFHHKYNYHADFYADKIAEDDVRILHYAGPKPHANPELIQSRYWIEKYNKYFNLPA
jgi:lipopolysaccharide biosynthesis glycosyltransferase